MGRKLCMRAGKISVQYSMAQNFSDPTSACNLKCTGCWAAEYGHTLSLTYEELDSIITQGKELGIYFYMYTGGEPLVRKADIIKLCEKHNDCAFHAFTNGTLVDDGFVKKWTGWVICPYRSVWKDMRRSMMDVADLVYLIKS